ncbi:MAG TPA: hypothetical protein VK420_00110 [Longimicrobium sp.]|nr:hypothetical protein [Longimicrobium sp.]
MKRALAAAAVAALLCAAPARAQTDDSYPAERTQSISILPFHFLFGFYAGDYERVVAPTISLGLGSSYFSADGYSYEELGTGATHQTGELNYATLEGKVRYYPSADGLNGVSFGLTFGPTWVRGENVAPGGEDTFTALGVGFEVARSHTMGVDRRFYYGYGGGGKRLFPVTAASGEAELVIPTLRLSVGVLF